MSFTSVICFLIALGVFARLQRKPVPPTDVVFLAGALAIAMLGVVPPKEILEGFGNPTVLTVGALLVVTAGVRSTGLLDRAGTLLVSNARDTTGVLRTLVAPILLLSAFVNNTPVVSMLIPIVGDWCRKKKMSPAKLLLPISYASILGGTCTLIGTSTNLVVSGTLVSEGLPPLGFFEIGLVGVPCAVLGAFYLAVFSHRLLPNASPLPFGDHNDVREFLVEAIVPAGSEYVGRRVADCKFLERLGLNLVDLRRSGVFVEPLSGEETVVKDDVLVFSGPLVSIIGLQAEPGLSLDTFAAVRDPNHSYVLTEGVLSERSSFAGRLVAETSLSTALVAVHCLGERLTNNVREMRLQPGDTVLLQVPRGFIEDRRAQEDFQLIAQVAGWHPRRRDRMWVACLLMILLVVGFVAGAFVDPSGPLKGISTSAMPALIVAALMVLTRCLPVSEARAALDLRVVLTIGAALGLGTALLTSGAIREFVSFLTNGMGNANPLLMLLVLYLLTATLSELTTNAAVAAMMAPVAIELARLSGLSHRPFVIAVAIAASSSFLTAHGYQTNLMVMGPGRYQAKDYLRVGLPLMLLVMVTSLAVIPLAWPF